ncbi:type VI secretion system protein ImpH [Methylobacterium sp. OAE515]|uniref:type VI secretion system baseplate subunit TssG n=1 Tax=Methylobacterium sp. OAE515 TaxID=2817895 RepID=UPI0017894A9B
MASPARFSFDAAVAVMMRASGQSDPGAAVRFEAALGLGYVPGDFGAIRATEAGGFKAETGVLGLTGPGGVLPRPYTATAIAQARQRSDAFPRFLNLLAQRPLAQFAQAGIKYRPHRAADAAAIAEGTTIDGAAAVPRHGMRDVLLALIGYADPNLSARLETGPDPLLYYAGLFASRPRSAERLAGMLGEWLGRPVEAEQFAGMWLELGRDQMTRLPRHGVGRFNQLGIDASAGVRAWNIGSRIVLRIGPLDERQFRALLPGGPLLTQVGALARAYLGGETAVVLRPVLAAAAVPPPRLGGASSCLLGWTSWLPVAEGRKVDAEDASFHL